MAILSSIGAPDISNLAKGGWHVVGVTRAGEVTCIAVASIQDLALEPEGGEDITLHQVGDGGVPFKLTLDQMWAGDAEILGQDILTLAQLRGITLGAATQYGVAFSSNGLAVGDLVRFLHRPGRVISGETMVGFEFYRDIICGAFGGKSQVPDSASRTVPLSTNYEPFIVIRSVEGEAVTLEPHWELESGDGSTTDFLLDHEPVVIEDTQEIIPDPRIIYVKVEDADGNLVEAGPDEWNLTLAPATLSFVTAPITGRDIVIAYAYDSAA